MNILRGSFRAQKYYIHSAKKKLFGKDLPLQRILFLSVEMQRIASLLKFGVEKKTLQV
ncbi:hypothetical protein [Haliscomenobacter hydrossis]|uniref:hypothetical protein n=1 Tax=Haliscomenobacter hydrossis TaxID=2350 RepID=UPI0003192232|nr:hypothetical protein [Haliscomenobacter hydrossis]